MKKKSHIFISLMILILAATDFFIISEISNYVTLIDITFIIFVFFYFITTKKLLLHKGVLYNTSAYFIYFFILSTVLIIMGTGINYLSYFYIVKEIIYMSMFFIIFKAHSINYVYSKSILTIFIIVSLVYGMISIITGNIAHYGIGSIVTTSPSQSGVVYLTCMFLSILYASNESNRIYILLAITSAMLVIATISRTAILGLMVFIATFLLLFLASLPKQRFSIKKVLIYMSTLFFILFVISISYTNPAQFFSTYLDKAIGRLMNLSNSLDVRKNMSSNYYNIIIGDSAIKLLFGQGKSIPEVITGKMTLAVDNQYTRVVLEGGLIGLSLWIIMVISWISILRKSINRLNAHFLYSFTAAYIVMGIGYEVFQASKSGISFWLILGTLYSIKYKRILDKQHST